MTDFSGKTVVITGASAGIGEATARLFATTGAKLVLIARRKERIDKLASELKAKCLPIALDVRDRAEVEGKLGSLPDEFSRVSILVNNAGLSRDLLKLQEGRPDGWDQMIDTNVKGLLYVTRTLLPGMVERGDGHVVNIGSIAGHEVYPGGNVYCATKHAVRALTKSMLIDLVDKPVRVTSIDPGLVETEFSSVRFYGDEERAKTVYQGYKPLEGRDIADAIVWACSRPKHVQIAEMIVLPADQAAAMVTHKALDE
jgi:3-hydroxy acid dehydrogenase/malonic semialdehyde reductase